MQPSRFIDHTHTSTGLRLMMEQDLHDTITDTEFKRLAIEGGVEPVDRHAKEWEFRISTAPFRRREKAKVVGWLPTRNDGRLTRMR